MLVSASSFTRFFPPLLRFGAPKVGEIVGDGRSGAWCGYFEAIEGFGSFQARCMMGAEVQSTAPLSRYREALFLATDQANGCNIRSPWSDKLDPTSLPVCGAFGLPLVGRLQPMQSIRIS